MRSDRSAAGAPSTDAASERLSALMLAEARKQDELADVCQSESPEVAAVHRYAANTLRMLLHLARAEAGT